MFLNFLEKFMVVHTKSKKEMREGETETNRLKTGRERNTRRDRDLSYTQDLPVLAKHPSQSSSSRQKSDWDCTGAH